MAANRLKGITLEIGGDTTDLSKALGDVNKEIKGTQDQLKDVQKLLKMDPGNIDLLKQKQKLLTDQVKNTKDKLEELKKAQQTMDANSVDKNSAQYQGLQREIIATEQELKQLEAAANQSNVALEAIGATADKVAAGASKVAEATKGLSMAAAGAVAGLAGLAYNAMTSADDLNTLAKQTGFSTDELQKFKYASDLVDVSVESITGAAAKLTQGMAAGKDAFALLGVSVTDVNGNMRDTSTVFYEVLEALGQVENGTLRDQLAMELFGKSANELAGIIDDGGSALQAYGQEAEELGLIMSGDMLNGLNEANDAFDKLKAQLSATLLQTGAKALEAFLPALQQIAAIIQKILGWLASLSPTTIQIFTTIAMIVAAISPVASIVAGIASAVSTLTTVMGMLNLTMLANPMVLMFAAAIGLVAAFTAAIVYLITHARELAQAFNDAWESIKAGFESFKETMRAGFEGIKANAQSAWESIKAGFESFKETMQVGFEGIKSNAQSAWENLKAGWESFIETATAGAQTLAQNVRSAIDAVVNTFKSLANGVISFVESAVNSAINALNSLIAAANAAANAIASLFGGSVSGIGSISNVSLPRFAKGGSISNGTALVGEAGPELLTVAGGRATVQPLTARLDPSSVPQLGGSQQVNVNVKFTGSLAQLAAVLQPSIEAETIRRGVSLAGR